MQVIDQNPVTQLEGATALDYMFSLGDCCLTYQNEAKAVVPLKLCAVILAHNLIRAGKGKKANKKLNNIMPNMVIVSLGAKTGILNINNCAI